MSSLHQDLIDYFERGAPQDGSGKALIESLPYLKFLGIETSPQADGTVLTTLPFQDQRKRQHATSANTAEEIAFGLLALTG